MTIEGKKAKREYMKKYKATHKNQIKAAQDKYWNLKGEKQKEEVI